MADATVVLLHGFLGFSHLGPIAYFRGVETMLRKAGIRVLVTASPPNGSIADRAQTIARQLFDRPDPAFALLGHSMGGLDARYLITHLDRDRRARSLVTVGTPHRGTPVAEWLLERKTLLGAFFRRIGGEGLRELTPDGRAAEPIPDREDVTYSSYASCRPAAELPRILVPFAQPMTKENDGLVPVDSAQWGHFRGIVRADHLEQVGWSLALPKAKSGRPFDHLPFWHRAVLEALATTENQYPK